MLHERLKYHRHRLNYSQKDVAKKIGVTRQAISKWETGKGIPDTENLLLLSQFYQVSLDQLLQYQVDDVTKFQQASTLIPIENQEYFMLLLVALMSYPLFPIGLVTIPLVFFTLIKAKVFYPYLLLIATLTFSSHLFTAYQHISLHTNTQPFLLSLIQCIFNHDYHI